MAHPGKRDGLRIRSIGTFKASCALRTEEIQCLQLSQDGEAPLRFTAQELVRESRDPDNGFGARIHQVLRRRGSKGIAAISPNGQMMALGLNQELELWDGASRKRPAAMLPINGKIRALAFSPDGQVLAIGTAEGRIGLTMGMTFCPHPDPSTAQRSRVDPLHTGAQQKSGAAGCRPARGSRADKPISTHSSSVERSPSGRPRARARSTRRMIFPDRVLGSLSTKWIASGRAMGPINLATCWRSSSASSSLGA